MKDSKGYIRRGSGKSALACAQIAQIAEKARKGDPFLAHTPIPPEAHQGADPATPPAGRTFGLCGAPDPATAGALKCAADFLEKRQREKREGPRPLREVIRGIYRELHEEIVPALRVLVANSEHERAVADVCALPIPGTILASGSAAPAGAAGSSTPPRDTPAPPPRRVEWGPAVRAYEALYAFCGEIEWSTAELYDAEVLARVRKATRGRIAPGGLSKLVSGLVRAGCARRPARGRFVLLEPTDERRAALERERRGAA